MNEFEQSDELLEEALRIHYQVRFQERYGPVPVASEVWRQVSAQLEPAIVAPPPERRWLQTLRAVMQAFFSPSPRRISRRGPVIAFSVILGVLLLISGVFSTAGVLGSLKSLQGLRGSSMNGTDALLVALLQRDPRASMLTFTSLHETKNTSAGTVKLEKIHADANNIILAYVADSVTSQAPTITLPGQQALKPLIMELNPEGGKVAVLAYFNGSSIKASAGHAQLSISIPTGKTTETFNLTVPFSAGKTVNVKRSISSHGETVTLDRVVITPSETRLYYTTSGIAKDLLVWEILVAGKLHEAAVGFVGKPESYASFWSGSQSADLQNQTGVWTVKVQGIGQFTFTVAS